VNEPLTDHHLFVAVPSLTEHAAVYHLCVLNLYIISTTRVFDIREKIFFRVASSVFTLFASFTSFSFI